MAEPPFEPLDFERRPPEEPFDPRAEHGAVRGYFRANPERFARVRRWVRQGRLGTPYDAYLARAVSYTVVAAGAGALVGAALTGLLVLAGAVPFGVLPFLVGTLAGGVLAGAGTASGCCLYPALRARRRANEIDAHLPHATVFLFSLAHGGTDLYGVVERLAGAQRTYGALADEFALLADETTRYGAGFFAALGRAREDTPSETFETFLDELNSVLEAGGDVNRFLREQADKHIERAERIQEQLLEDLATLAEVYVTLVFAGPVFLVVILVVISFARPSAFGLLQALVYVAIPAAVLAFYALFRSEVGPYAARTGDLKLRPDTAPDPPDDERVAAYRAEREPSPRERLLRRPLAALVETPRLALYVGGGLGFLAAVALALAGVVPRTPAGAFAEPIAATTAFAVLPFCTAGLPYAVVYERERRRRREIRRDFPAALEVLADANRNGVPLAESFDLVSRRLSGPLATEIERLHNDTGWSADPEAALARFADRLGSPAVSRATALLVESVHATGDLAPVFDIVGEDLSRRNDIRENRRQGMQPYLLVVVIGTFVFLGIVMAFDLHFLPVAERAAERASGAGAALNAAPIRVQDIHPQGYRTVFYHAALVQAAANGLLAGALVDDRLASGVKYAVALVALTAAVFLLI
jgi:flagellar protein FlaJ